MVVTLRISHCLDNGLTDGGIVVSPMILMDYEEREQSLHLSFIFESFFPLIYMPPPWNSMTSRNLRPTVTLDQETYPVGSTAETCEGVDA
jgi:hypothetical protein